MLAFLIVILIILAVLGIITLNIHLSQSARQQLQSWANNQKFTLAHVERCWFWFGPFTFRSGRGHIIYRFSITTPNRQSRHGYARIGTWCAGAFGNQVSIAWDDQPGKIHTYP